MRGSGGWENDLPSTWGLWDGEIFALPHPFLVLFLPFYCLLLPHLPLHHHHPKASHLVCQLPHHSDRPSVYPGLRPHCLISHPPLLKGKALSLVRPTWSCVCRGGLNLLPGKSPVWDLLPASTEHSTGRSLQICCSSPTVFRKLKKEGSLQCVMLTDYQKDGRIAVRMFNTGTGGTFIRGLSNHTF